MGDGWREQVRAALHGDLPAMHPRDPALVELHTWYTRETEWGAPRVGDLVVPVWRTESGAWGRKRPAGRLLDWCYNGPAVEDPGYGHWRADAVRRPTPEELAAYRLRALNERPVGSLWDIWDDIGP